MTQALEPLILAGTAVIGDVLDAMGHLPIVLDNAIAPVNFSGAVFAGPAYTVTGELHQWSGGGDRAKLAAIDGMPRGALAVWAGTNIRGVCCFGDLLSTAMQARGCAGVIVDGGVRDVAFLRTLSLPIMARYRTPAQAIGRWRVVACEVPVQVRGALHEWITIQPGDIVVGDDDGVISVPKELVDSLIEKVVTWSSGESEARREIQQGLPLLEALAKYGHL
jgi:4-hydroxy-4-methyl-2-oxoglutarate aldolase